MRSICAKTRMDVALCGCDPCEVTVLATVTEERRFSVIRMSEIPYRMTEWVIPGLLPASDVVVLVGEEGIGKGLWWIEQIRQVTTRGEAVVLIVAEDDPSRALRPRMEAAGVDLDLVHLIVVDPETLTGHPYLPTDSDEVEKVIAETGARLLILDPWISVVPGHLSLKDSQQARAALDPLTVLARRTTACILAVAHTNRTDGSTRDRVGLTAVLRQSCRVLIMAIEDPDDETSLLVGIDKANNTHRGPAVRWLKSGEGDAWCVSLVQSDTGLTIQEWDAQIRAARDQRTTTKWAEVQSVARAAGGMVTRSEVVAIYGGPEHVDAADKAIARWTANGRLVRNDRGIYEVPTAAAPHYSPGPSMSIAGGTGGNGASTPPTPRESDTDPRGAVGGSPDLIALESLLDAGRAAR